MIASSSGIALIKSFEGFTPVPYYDNSQYSWGYGTKAPGPTGTITKDQAHNELVNHVTSVTSDINKYVLNKGVPLSQNQFDALTSLVYNVGSGAIFTADYNNGYTKGSTLYNRLLKRDYEGAGSSIKDFNKINGVVSSGLTKRRANELALWSTGIMKDPIKMGAGLVLINLSVATFLLYHGFKKF